mgnify:CR=1 FL=1
MRLHIQAILRQHADELRRIEGDELIAVSATQQHMLSNVTTLQSTATSLPASINTSFTSLEDTETKVQTNGTDIVKTVSYLSPPYLPLSLPPQPPLNISRPFHLYKCSVSV